ncbi:leucine-rich PPR motif-containing protein, mitochondrial [Wyeomyia smithii]|uniref:leucine-rich PPR motif-containing protein, mitochondrial n=1 Tax=Wyeomyia smithii TaxID=174621 RepID=UPI002467C61E|nr:leucine-rich PPR motif-containing protein, mitochondrial [Wyeomyia smithii]
MNVSRMNVLRNVLTKPALSLRPFSVSRTFSRSVIQQAEIRRSRYETSCRNVLLPAVTINSHICRFNGTRAKPVKREKNTLMLVEELTRDARTYRRIPLDKLNQVLAKPEAITADAYDFLLSCCGRLLMEQTAEVRMRLFKSIWFMAGGGDTATLNRWKVLLQVHRDNGINLDGEDVGQFINRVKVSKDEEFYALLLGAVAERGDIAKMDEAIAEAREEGFGSSGKFVSLLVRGYFRAGDLSAVQTVLDEITDQNVKLDSNIVGELLVGRLTNKQVDEAVEIIKKHGLILKEQHILEAIKEALLVKQNEIVALLLDLLPPDVLNAITIDPALRNVCSELLGLKRFAQIKDLINLLPVPRFKSSDNYDSYATSLIFEMIKTKAPFEEIASFVEFLVRTNRNTRALHVACDCASKSWIDSLPKFLTLLRQQEDLRPHYFWPLIVQNFDRQGESGVLDVLKMMQSLDTTPDEETLSVFVLPKLSITLKDVRMAFKVLDDRGVKAAVLMSPFVTHLLYQSRFDDVSKIIKLYPTKINTQTMVYPLVLQSQQGKNSDQLRRISNVLRNLTEKAQNPKHDLAGQLLIEIISNRNTKFDTVFLKSFLEEYERANLRISRMSANVLRNHLSKTKQVGAELDRLLQSLVDDQLGLSSREMSDSIYVHPRDMNYAELECHLTELEEKKMNARGVLRRLLQLCIRENRLKRAVELKRKCDQAQVDLSSGLMASLLELSVKLKNVDEAGRMLAQIKQTYPGFLLDDHKIVDFAALLVENGFLEKARGILKERASSGTIRPGNANKNIWNLLNNTAQYAAGSNAQSEHNQCSEMLQFLIDLGYCGYENALLGPIIREYLLKNQILNAVTEFLRIATEHRKTPLQLEVFTILVRLTNSNDPEIPPEMAKKLLAEVIRVGSGIHGSVNTNNTLLVALADAGTEAQLRRILINPETHINQEYIMTQCEFLINSGKLDVVLRLAKCSRGLANIREADFLALILKQYVRDNDCEAAVGLFHRLQAEDAEMKITGDFAKQLIDLLEVNNYEVPTGIRLYAK